MLRIGPHNLNSRVLLAPMAGVSDPVFRRLCIEQGAGLAASEMIVSDTSLYATTKTRHRLERPSEQAPHAVQIVGYDPSMLAEAAVVNVAHGADIIDINMGCPAKKVCKRAAGSALLSDPQLVREILAAVVRAVDVPVTLKIRTGPDRANRNAVDIARIAEGEGVACLAVHGRTRADRFTGDAEFNTIASIREVISIPLIANGDVNSLQRAREVLRFTGADGIMIGRAAQGNPWIFRELSLGLDTDDVSSACTLAFAAPTRRERHATLREHLQGLYRLYGEYRGVRIARKHIAWYCKGLPHATVFREQANTVSDPTRQLKLVDAFFESPEQFSVAA